MAHKYTILVSSKEEGDFQTEDELMKKIQDFAVELRDQNEDRAFVLVAREFGVDPGDYARSLEIARKASESSS